MRRAVLNLVPILALGVLVHAPPSSDVEQGTRIGSTWVHTTWLPTCCCQGRSAEAAVPVGKGASGFVDRPVFSA